MGEDVEVRSDTERAQDEWLHWRAELALLRGDAETAANIVAQLRDPGAHGFLVARVLAAEGRAEAAHAALERRETHVLRTRGTLHGLEIERASVLLRLSDPERALELLSDALGRGAIDNTTWGQDGHAYPNLAPLWADPRFKALIKPRG